MRRALLLLPVLLPLLAQAQTLDMNQGGPVEITADDGIEWRQQEQVVVARGNARAVRDGVTVDADRLIARYRPRGGAADQPQRAGENPASGSEIWRLEAEGNVRINSATEQARGTRAVYDMDQSVLVLSGAGLSLTTPEQRITARDSLEYWPARRMAVARGDAVVLSQDGRQVAADTLVGYFLDAQDAPAAPAQPRASIPGLPGGGGNSRIDRVEAYGNVEIRTAEEVVRGERGVYSPQTGLARLLGQVRITRGENQLNGQEAIVNLRTGVSRLVSAPGQRVQGLVVPQQDQPDRAVVPAPQRPQPRAERPPLPERSPAR
ncbi:MAG TPA: LptA/OstA family protein [Acetobacteraceae bacterium]|jgi:lipopolysaccharide export system protein LptA|nr:LptA/OstA family protein [Acetobacteraceae bacterium]